MPLRLRHAGGRLVEKQHPRLAGERHRNLEQALLAVRQRGGADVEDVDEAKARRQVDDVGNHARVGAGRDWWRLVGKRPELVDEVAQILESFRLTDVMDERTGILPYGKQRLLEIAVAVASRPRVLLLDEPAAGVPEDERHMILGIVAALPADVSVLLIEHDMELVFQFARRITVLVNGALFVEGTPDEIARDARVKEVYLGEAADG